MSIEKRVVTLSRSFRSLIKTRAALAKHIKDLKDLRILGVRACYRHSGPTDLRTVFYRSAGACPPRALECADDGEGNPLGCACGIRGPSPYDEGAFCRRSPGRRAVLLHRDQEVSPTGIYETPSVKYTIFYEFWRISGRNHKEKDGDSDDLRDGYGR